MKNEVKSFYVDNCHILGNELIVQGRCLKEDIYVNDVFLFAYSLIEVKENGSLVELRQGAVSSIYLSVKDIYFFRRKIDVLSSGCTGDLILTGEDYSDVGSDIVISNTKTMKNSKIRWE